MAASLTDARNCAAGFPAVLMPRHALLNEEQQMTTGTGDGCVARKFPSLRRHDPDQVQRVTTASGVF